MIVLKAKLLLCAARRNVKIVAKYKKMSTEYSVVFFYQGKPLFLEASPIEGLKTNYRFRLITHWEVQSASCQSTTLLPLGAQSKVHKYHPWQEQ